MNAQVFAERIAKQWTIITASRVMDLMGEEGLHPDDDYPDVEQALEAEGVRITEETGGVLNESLAE